MVSHCLIFAAPALPGSVVLRFALPRLGANPSIPFRLRSARCKGIRVARIGFPIDSIPIRFDRTKQQEKAEWSFFSFTTRSSSYCAGLRAEGIRFHTHLISATRFFRTFFLKQKKKDGAFVFLPAICKQKSGEGIFNNSKIKEHSLLYGRKFIHTHTHARARTGKMPPQMYVCPRFVPLCC